MLTLRNKLFRNHENTVLPSIQNQQKASDLDASTITDIREYSNSLISSSKHAKEGSLKHDTSSTFNHSIQGMTAQIKTRHFNHLHLNSVAHETMTLQKAHWLAKILHLSSTEISQFHTEELSNFDQDHKSPMLLIRIDEYHELVKLSTGQSRIFAIKVALPLNPESNSIDNLELGPSINDTKIFLQGCKAIISKKTNNIDAFAITIPNGSSVLDITVQVYAKPKISKTATIRDVIKASKSKAKSAYHNIITRLSPTTSHGNISLFSDINSHYGAYDSHLISPECDDYGNSPISSGRHSNSTGMNSIRYHSNTSNEQLTCTSNLSQLSGRQVIANVTFRQEINGNMFHQPSIQLQLTRPSDPNVVLAELRLGIAIFLNRQDWMNALVVKKHQNNILLAKELYSTVCHSDYLTVQIHQPSPKIPIWNRYWAMLQGFHISLFDFQYKESRPAEFILELKHIVRVKKSEPERIMQPNSFVIVAENGTRHYVFADSESSRKGWMKQIEVAVKRCRPTY